MPTRYVPSSAQGGPSESLRDSVERAVGARVRSWTRPDTGLSPAHRFVVELSDGTGAFVKAATTPETAAWLRNEHRAISFARHLAPRVIAWVDDAGGGPLLVTERLDGHWPASHAGVDWRAGDLERVFDAVRDLARLPAPAGLGERSTSSTRHWRDVQTTPGTFLSLSLCSRAWFARHVDELASAEQRLVRSGTSFVHGDVRSDNICVLADRVCLVDWSHAGSGPAETDLAMFLPAAHLEGGPSPYSVLPDAGPWAAMQSGALIRRAVDDASNAPDWLRSVFRRLAAINLDWACESLRLTPRDGIPWRKL